MTLYDETDPIRVWRAIREEHPISTDYDGQVIHELLQKARERLRLGNGQSSPLIIGARDNMKGLHLNVFNRPELKKIVDTSPQAVEILSEQGHYDSLDDSVTVGPHIQPRPELLSKTDQSDHLLGDVFLEALSTLRHELSHRERHYESMDTDTPMDMQEADRYNMDPELLEYSWEQTPDEWTAMADSLGYLLHLVKGRKLPINRLGDQITNLSTNSGLADALWALDQISPNLHALTVPNVLNKRRRQDALNSSMYDKALTKWYDRVRDSYNRGDVEISDENLKNVENKLLKAAEGYKGTTNIKQQLIAEAATDGIKGLPAAQLVKRVLDRLNNTETGERGRTLGKAQNPVSRWKKLATQIKRLRSY